MFIKDSPQCGKSELDLFTVPPTQVAIEDGIWDDILPFPTFRTQEVQFEIRGDGEHYLDLSQTELWMTLVLCKKGSDKPLTDMTGIGLVNNLMHSMFSQCQISVNNIEIENTNSNYPYRAYFENLLCYDKEAKETFLAQELFVKDTADNFETFALKEQKKSDAGVLPVVNEVLKDSLNEGLIDRVKRFEKGNPVEVRGPIHADLFKCARYLLPSVSVQIKLSRQSPEFYMVGSTTDCHLIIQDCFLRVRRNRVNPSIYANHLMMLEKTTAKYPVERVIMKSAILPFSATVSNLANIHNGILPSRVVVGFVDTEAYSGRFTKNPFNFQNFNVSLLRLKCASRSCPYTNGVRMKYKTDQYLQAYNTLFQGLNGGSNDITYEDYASGYAIYAFDLSPDACHGDHFSILREGSLDLEVNLDSSVASSITAIFYLEFNNIVEISKQNQVQLDYQI